MTRIQGIALDDTLTEHETYHVTLVMIFNAFVRFAYYYSFSLSCLFYLISQSNINFLFFSI